jgi:ATP-dependent DNA helicase DinG
MVSRLHQLLRELQAEDPGGPNLEFLVQGEQPKALILERFRQLQAPVLLGSASFWEGVDVVGQQLSLVVIDKLPFTPPDEPILAARMRKAVAAGEDFFSNWQLPQAAISLKQGAGRLIRSESDKGLLVVCDERLALRAYGRQLLRSLPPFPLLRNAVDAVEFLTEFRADGTLALANVDSGPCA